MREEEPHEREERGVSYDGTLYLGWKSRSGSPESTPFLESDRDERLLRALLLFQESHHREGTEDGGERSTEMVRIEAKLDLLFDLVCQLLKGDAKDAEPCPARLWMDRVSWITTSENPPSVGEPLWLSLFLDPDIPQPLRLPVRVTEVQREETSGCRIEATIENLEDSLDDLWGRFIFRQHRRMIARQKARERNG